MAFNNPSSRTPVSYGSATKSLGYIVGTIGRAFSSDDDEGAQLLSKKKAKGERRFMVGACCCCILVLVSTVCGFIWILQSMTYPGELHGDVTVPIANRVHAPNLFCICTITSQLHACMRHDTAIERLISCGCHEQGRTN